MESRQLLSITAAPIHLGAVYFEDSSPNDQVGDVFEISFNGGAPGTQLTELRINTDKMNDGLGLGDAFFDTAAGGLGAFGSAPFTIVSRGGIDSVTAQVTDGGTQLVLKLQGFDAGEKLVFSIDVDEQGFLEPNAVAEGAEFEGSTLSGDFVAPHYQQGTAIDMFLDAFDSKLAGSGLALPNDGYNPPSSYMPPGSSPGPVYTAGAILTLQQNPLPITLSGTVFQDFNANNKQENGDTGISGVHLSLYELVDGNYVATGQTTVTDANGNYKFDGLLPSTYRVVETQPDGYLSVGAAAGTVDGTTRGVVTSVDALSSINLDGGDDSVHNDFAETRPAQLSGHVYHDANNNGAMDAGEEGIGGVHLVIHSQSTSIDVYTADDGSWSATGLMPGTYTVTESQPEAYLDGLDAAGSAGGTAHNPGDLIDEIVLTSGMSGINYDFGELISATISGYVYVDANNNGIYDKGETPIADVQLTLLDADGNPVGPICTTDEAGYYEFTDIVPGTYGVAEAQPVGYRDGLDAAGTTGGIAHNPGDLVDMILAPSGAYSQHNNFGELLSASVSGYVYVDANNNGIFEPTEKPLEGVLLTLLDAAGNPAGPTCTTDANGYYEFVDLIPGTYSIQESQPPRPQFPYFDGLDTAGAVDGIAIGIAYNDLIIGIQLDAGKNGANYNFGELPPAKISGYVFQDGPTIVLEPGEAMPDLPSIRSGDIANASKFLAGVTLKLCDGSGYPVLDDYGNPITTQTDAWGHYEFAMLRPNDEYSIIEVEPAGYLTGLDRVGKVSNENSPIGKASGYVYNKKYEIPDPSILSTFAIDPSGPAIIKIQVGPGDNATDYNFSHVLVESTTTPPEKPRPPIGFPPPDPWPTMPRPAPRPVGEYQRMAPPYITVPQIVMALPAGGSGGPAGYSWHLSIIDAGQPRRDGSGDKFAQYPQNSLFDPVSWSGPDMAQSQWVLADENGDPIKTVRYGMPGATPVLGDWDGSGTTKVGVFIDGLWFLDLNGNAAWDSADLWVKLGKKGDQAVSGDWNGDGKSDVGIFGPAWIGDLQAVAVEPGLPDAMNPPMKSRPKNVPPDPNEAAVGWRTMQKSHAGTLRSDLIDHVFQYGSKGDRALAGDWNGDGIFTAAIFRDGAWYLDMDGDGHWSAGDLMIEFGQAGDLPVAGDWTGDGITKLGVYRSGEFILDSNNNRQIDASDKVIHLGNPGDQPVAGDWTGDGIDKVGVYQQSAPPANQTASAAGSGAVK